MLHICYLWIVLLVLLYSAASTMIVEKAGNNINLESSQQAEVEQPSATVSIQSFSVPELATRYTIPAGGPPDTGTVLHIDTFSTSINPTNLKIVLHEAEVQIYAIPDRRKDLQKKYDCGFGPVGRDHVRIVLSPINRRKPTWNVILNAIDGLKAFTANGQHANEMRLAVFQDDGQVAVGSIGHVDGPEVVPAKLQNKTNLVQVAAVNVQ